MPDTSNPRTLFDKVWDAHVMATRPDGQDLVAIDRHLLHEGSFHAFWMIDHAGRRVRRPDLTFAIADHYVPTSHGRVFNDPSLKKMVTTLVANTGKHGVMLMGLDDPRQGIVHVVGPE